jgi:predicted acylesterase/phospholipase RssA
MVISGGVSLGAYEAGYNWAMIKMLNELKASNRKVRPELRSVAGASAGSINALLSAMYWCQKESIPLRNTINDNLFYETWVNLGLEDLMIKGKNKKNRSTLFTRKKLREKGALIIDHLKKPIYKKGCTVPLGFSVTKVTPMIEEFEGIKIKNQHFSVPFVLKEKKGKMTLSNKNMPPSSDFYISIPGVERDIGKITDVLYASSAFPGAFQQVKLHYIYQGKKYSSYFIDGGEYDNIPL